jgi:hypothetical protein
VSEATICNESTGFVTTTMRGLIVKHEDAEATMAAERYALGELHDSELEQFEEHFFSCPECAQDVRDLAALTEGAREFLQQPRNTEPATRRAATRAAARRWPWLGLSPNFAWGGALAAMTLCTLAIGYQAAHLRGLVRPQALASILLRPETRGEAASIPVQRIGAFLLLEADLPGATGDLQWDIQKTGSEKVIHRETSPSPEGSASFKVLLPASLLAPAEYTLTVSSATMPSEKPRFFRFKIASGER